MRCNHKIRKKQGRIIPEKDCKCCQSNMKFLKAITKEKVTQEEYNQALKEYHQE